MAYIVVNKKKFYTFLTVLLLGIAGLIFYFIWQFVLKDGERYGEERANYFEEHLERGVGNGGNNNIEIGKNKSLNEIENKDEFKEKKLIEYENQKFSYGIKFKENWHMNNDSSESDFEEIEIDEDIKIKSGGQTFWSNYSNINDYSPENKPNDFHLLNLTVYQKENINIDELAKILEFDNESEKMDFEADSIKGYQYIAPGITAGNPRVAVIFQKDSSFYVFRLAFIGGDANVARDMEEIISSFTLK